MGFSLPWACWLAGLPVIQNYVRTPIPTTLLFPFPPIERHDEVRYRPVNAHQRLSEVCSGFSPLHGAFLDIFRFLVHSLRFTNVSSYSSNSTFDFQLASPSPSPTLIVSRSDIYLYLAIRHHQPHFSLSPRTQSSSVTPFFRDC